MIEIKEVETKKDIKLFASYPIKLYKDCPYYVPSLRSDEKNSFNPKKNFNLENNKFKAFLCYKEGELVGRIAGLINYKYNEISGKKLVRFSRFECIDDIEVFKALLGAVEKFGKENDMDTIHGPWGFNDTDREGMLTYGFDHRSTYATNYYYPYFSKYMPQLGFKDESKWVEFNFNYGEPVDERRKNIADRLQKKYQLVDICKTLTIKEVVKYYGDAFFDTYNEAYKDLDGFVPVTGEAKKNVLSQFATIANRRYVSILVNPEGEVAAFGVMLPSICKPIKKHGGKLFPTGFMGVLRAMKKPKELEMALLAVKTKYRNTGIVSIIVTTLYQNILDDKVKVVESNPMLESNLEIQQTWKTFNTEIIKKRQTYIKKID